MVRGQDRVHGRRARVQRSAGVVDEGDVVGRPNLEGLAGLRRIAGEEVGDLDLAAGRALGAVVFGIARALGTGGGRGMGHILPHQDLGGCGTADGRQQQDP